MTRRRMLTAFERVSRATTPTSNARKNTCLLLFSPFIPLVPLFSWLSSNCKKVHRLLHASVYVCVCVCEHDTSRFMENTCCCFSVLVAFLLYTSRDLAVSINCTIVVNRTIDGNGGIEENDGGDETNRNVREEISWV